MGLRAGAGGSRARRAVEVPNHIRHLFEPGLSRSPRIPGSAPPAAAAREEERNRLLRLEKPTEEGVVVRVHVRPRPSVRPPVRLSVPFAMLVSPELGSREVKMKVGQNGEEGMMMMMMGESAAAPVVRTS